MGLAPFAPALFDISAHAQQRVEVRPEFRVALDPHGRFERHSRYGEVWRPNRMARDWRPYTVGRWVYTDDWGWYWNADQAEADWGWVVYHYGRWVDDREMGWVWVPGDEWGPAWVNWRRGEGPAVATRGQRGPAGAEVRYIGWAPLPPDEAEAEYVDNPDVWIFVRARDIVAPRISTVIIRERRPEILQRTVVVNRTVVVRDRGVIVNPGIPPSYVAAFVGRPIMSYEVRPRVIVGTTRINNAIEVRAEDLRDRRRFQQARPVIRETRTRIEAIRDVPPPQALQANERGRLGDRPPRAAAEGGPDRRDDRTTGDRRGPDGRPLPGERPSATTQDQRDPSRRDMAPGRTGATPGQAETAPGRAGTAPGQGGQKPPGRADTAPGRAGDTPGQAGTAPGQRDRSTTERSTTGTDKRSTTGSDTRSTTGSDTRSTTNERGRSGAAPGRNETTPGQAETAPGRKEATPGQSGAKPPGQAGATPGQSGANPGRSADAPGRAQDRGAQQREERGEQNRGAQQREERGSERRPERASEPRGRGEATGTTPGRGEAAGGARGESGAREQRAPQRPDAQERRRERENQ